MGPEIELPSGIDLIVEACRGECGDTPAIARVYRDPAGQLRIDSLVTLLTLGLSPPSSSDPNGAYFTGVAASDDASLIYVSVCTHGSCTIGSPSANSESAIFQSTDGGVTWSELVRGGGTAFVTGVLSEDNVVVAVYSGETAPPVYQTFPRGATLTPPPGVAYLAPILLANGDIVWPTNDQGILRSDGSQWLGEWADPSKLQLSSHFSFDLSSERAITFARTIVASGVGIRLLLVVRPDGSLQQAFSAPKYVAPAVWLDQNRILGAVTPDAVSTRPAATVAAYPPALIDLRTRLIHSIADAALAPIFSGQIVAVQRGPFARVVNTDNTCLYIRTEPGSAGQALDCAAEGVLLTDLGPFQFVEGSTWMRVRSPSGLEGWASVNYLEASPRS